jgi:hypothetical protein
LRDPAYPDAQKDFRGAFIVTSDVPYNDAYAFFTLLAYRLNGKVTPVKNSYFTPFYWATGKRGTLDMTLPIDLTVPVLMPDKPTPTPLPTSTSTTAPSLTYFGVKPTQTISFEQLGVTSTEESKPGKSGICGLMSMALIFLPAIYWTIKRKFGK